jgi:hypothetical protein
MRVVLSLILAASLALASTPTFGQEKAKKPKPVEKLGDQKATTGKRRVFDFGALSFEGSMRTPQLLYFLSRVKQELDRAALEKRSFMPELRRSVDEGGL